jgi:hypothetical protein
MAVRILRVHESAIPIHISDRYFSTCRRKIRYLVEDTDWDQEILKQEKWIDLCCWSIIGFSAMYFGIVCMSILIR